MNKEETILEWLKELPDGYRERALKNYDPNYHDGSPINDLADAVVWGFCWEDSPEKNEFWLAVWWWALGRGDLPSLPEVGEMKKTEEINRDYFGRPIKPKAYLIGGDLNDTLIEMDSLPNIIYYPDGGYSKTKFKDNAGVTLYVFDPLKPAPPKESDGELPPLPQETGWIRVEDGLPTHSNEVLLTDGSWRTVGFNNGGCWMVYEDEPMDMEHSTFTHWMEYPELPKEEE